MLIKQLHSTLKSGTSDARKDWFAVGEHKKIPNEVGGRETTAPEHVAQEMAALRIFAHRYSNAPELGYGSGALLIAIKKEPPVSGHDTGYSSWSG